MTEFRVQNSDFRQSSADEEISYPSEYVIDFRGLKVWSKAHALTLQVYRETFHALRKDRGLASQMRRAAVSVAANIVEGCGRATEAELGRFLRIALASAVELEYHLLLARDIGYLPDRRYDTLRSATHEVKRMLTGLLKRIDEHQ